MSNMNPPNDQSLNHINWIPEPSSAADVSGRLDPESSREEAPVEPEVKDTEGRQVRFKVRIVDLDHAMLSPGPLDLHSCQFLPRDVKVLKVPVVRIYGANEGGQKTCLHVHQAYPYFYVPYEGSLEPMHLQGYIHQLGMSLNHAAAITFNTPQDLRRSQYVAAIIPIKGIPFYGYHVGYSYFLKIYLFNPDYENRIVELMRSGAIMGTHFQPFEAHVPFKLQFCIDFNLYGMGWIELEGALLRNSIAEPEEGDHHKRLTTATVEDSMVWSNEIDPGRISNCEIEMDTTVDSIVNRDRAPERNIHQNLAECFQIPSGTAQVPSMAGLWEDDARRRKANGLPSQDVPKTQARDPESIPWLNQDINKKLVADMIQGILAEQMKSQIPTPTQGDFDNFPLRDNPLGASFMTAYQSIDFLCPRIPERNPEDAVPDIDAETSFVFEEGDSSIIVDESIISQSAANFQAGEVGDGLGMFKGLSGLGGIEEQDEDEEYPMPDIDDFLEDDFLDDDMALWSDHSSPDTDPQGDEGFADDELNIPQFDGGGDGLPDSPERKRSAADEWRRASSDLKRRARASSRLVDKESSSSESGRAAISHTSVRRPQLLTSAPSVSPMAAPKSSSSPGRSASARKQDIRSKSTTVKARTSQRAAPQPSEREFVRYVEIPPMAKRNKQDTKLRPLLKPHVSEDPIIDLDDDDEMATAPARTPSPVNAADPIDEIEEISQYSDDEHPREATRTTPTPSKSPLKLEYGYPEPISPGRQYFLTNMDEMWSSPSPPLLRPAFHYSPPRPTSPDLIPSHGPSNDWSRRRHSSMRSVASLVSGDGSAAIYERRQSDVIEQSVLLSRHADDSLDAPINRGGCSDSPDVSKIIAAEDSIMAESNPYTPEQVEPNNHSVLNHAFITKNPSQSHSNSGSPPNQVCSAESQQCAVYKYHFPAPKTSELLSSLELEGLPNFVHQKPYYSVEGDVPSKVKVFGGKEFRLQSKGIKTMGAFNSIFDRKQPAGQGEGFRFWEPTIAPPSQKEIAIWLREDKERIQASLRSKAEPSTQKKKEIISQIEGPTQKNPFGYKNSPTKVAGSMAVEKDFIDILSMELHCSTRGSLLPDPKKDSILAVFYCWQTENESLNSNGWVPGYRVGVITRADAGLNKSLASGRVGVDMHIANNEEDMLEAVIDIVLHLDPDILAGFEVHNLSWGYMVDRYQILTSRDMSKLLARVKPSRAPVLTKSAMEARNSFNSTHNSGLKITGRHLFNVWRLIRGEVALTNYSFCSIVFHILQQRIPHYSHETLTKWWEGGHALHQSRVMKNYFHRAQYNLQLIESQELVSRTSEFARVFGVDFFSVISRGSQYKVESLMIRLAKPENFLMISPSRAQVGGQRALEVIPMVMEPESGFYEDPVVVLDFQSLYPSMVIAYNYCYSTCLGKLGGGTKLGVTDYRIQDGILPLVQDHLQVAPNHVMYVNQDVRRGLLGRMLTEILDTRVMVKKAMKEFPENKSLLKLLEARQLSLKFVANVTYGYTSASYSGRMPSTEIADSIVSSGRETLERAIRFVNENPKWNARVVYGDTDSMFIQLKGRTRQEAFDIGYDISETVTRMNPRPVKLKFEKVYHPCFLVTKKRYVGASYETPNQTEPVFDAKGIETIRRDGIPAVQKIMETCIKTMFRTQDLSQVKSYFVRQLGKILDGRVPVPDLMFGKEVRMGGYSEKGVPPPGAVVSARKMDLDPRAEPQYRERVPYVVVYGDPGARLTDQVVDPKELLRNTDLRLNGEYYIRKHVIPSLERIFQLAGADVKSWFDEMPRVHRTSLLSLPGSTSAGAATVIPTETTSATIAAEQSRQQLPLDAIKDPLGTVPSGVGPSSETLLAPPKFKPKRKGGRGVVTIGPRIDQYYQSQLCTVCGKLVMVNQKTHSELCADCSSEQGRLNSMLVLQGRINKAERMFKGTLDVCGSCCRSVPLGGAGVGDGTHWDPKTGGTGPANTGIELIACESIECTVFWQRRRAQDGVQGVHARTVRILDELKDLDLSF